MGYGPRNNFGKVETYTMQSRKKFGNRERGDFNPSLDSLLLPYSHSAFRFVAS